MVGLLLFAGLAIVPILLVVLFRANGTTAFLSVCLGYLLAHFVSADIVEGLALFVKLDKLIVGDYLQLALLVLPVLLVLIFSKGSFHGGEKKFVHVLPGVAAGLLLALLAVEFMPKAMQADVKAFQYWRTMSNLQTGIVLFGTFFGLTHLFLDRPKHEGHGKKHGK